MNKKTNDKSLLQSGIILLMVLFCTMSNHLLLPGVSAGETVNGSIIHDGIERDYILYVPDSYSGDNAVPLILNFHGYTSNALAQMNYGDFRPIADASGFLVVHPEGTLLEGKTHWNVGGWTSGSTVDDVGFTDALIDALAFQYNIDLTRVYATGMSNGGYMSFLLACQLSGKIAAIASVTGSMTPETYNECIPQRPIPIMQFHGTADLSVPYEGNSWSKSIDDVLTYWSNFNGCNPTAAVIDIPDIDPNDGSTVEHYVFSGGDNGVTVEHFKVHGGAHTWPGSNFNSGGTNYDIDASSEIWEFFSRYDINGLILPDLGLDLTISHERFQPGDIFTLTAAVSNPGPVLDAQPMAVLMDVFGSYFWHPSWSGTFEYESIQVNIGTTDHLILDFTWPEVSGSVDGIRFYGALLSTDFTSILGTFDMVEFGWGN